MASAISSSETSRVNRADFPEAGYRVQNKTLLLSGSPEATPWGKSARRSRQRILERRGAGKPHAAAAPQLAAATMNARRFILSSGCSIQVEEESNERERDCSRLIVVGDPERGEGGLAAVHGFRQSENENGSTIDLIPSLGQNYH